MRSQNDIEEGPQPRIRSSLHTRLAAKAPRDIAERAGFEPGEDPPVLSLDFSSDRFFYVFALEANKAQCALQCEGPIRYADENGTLRNTGFLRRHTKASGRFMKVSDEYEYED